MSYMSRSREPVNSLTHMIGAVVFAVGTLGMILRSGVHSNFEVVSIVSAVVFGVSLVALYSSSAIYHFSTAAEGVVERLRKLDHSMIYVLIAGTYTPILLRFFTASRSWILLGIMWAMAVSGIVMKLTWIKMPRLISTAYYLLMGWFIMFDPPALANLPTGAFWLLLGGGISYTCGGVIYAFKKPNLGRVIGYHELFHLFILLGSFLHFWLVFIYII